MIKGSCHCGNIRLEVETDPTEAIECNCSHCSRKGLILAFVPEERVTIAEDPDWVATYTFNKHVIRHRFCRTCGVQPYGRGQGKDGPTVALNLRCFEIDLGALDIKPFDGRSS